MRAAAIALVQGQVLLGVPGAGAGGEQQVEDVPVVGGHRFAAEDVGQGGGALGVGHPEVLLGRQGMDVGAEQG